MSIRPPIFLITGASRGIGLALAIRELFARFNKNIAVIAAVRNPSTNTPELDEITAKYPGILSIVKYVATDLESVQDMAQFIQHKYGHVDVVVANAGIDTFHGPVSKTPLEEMRNHWEVNALGPLMLFQALAPLLERSSNPKFIPISSGLGSSFYYDAPVGQTAYGSSKAVLNFITKKIHCENEWITAFPLAPGVIESDLTRTARAKDDSGVLTKIIEELVLSPEIGAAMLVDIIISSTRATHGGELINIDGRKLPW